MFRKSRKQDVSLVIIKIQQIHPGIGTATAFPIEFISENGTRVKTRNETTHKSKAREQYLHTIKKRKQIQKGEKNPLNSQGKISAD